MASLWQSSFPTYSFMVYNCYMVMMRHIVTAPIELYRFVWCHNVLTNTMELLYDNYGRQVYYVKIEKKNGCVNST